MNVDVMQGSIQSVAADAIIVNLFEGVAKPKGATGAVDRALNGAITDLITGGDLTGKLGKTAVLYPRGDIPARRVIVVGLGKADTVNLEAVREASAAATLTAHKLGATTVATTIHGGGAGRLNVSDAAQAVVEGSLLALYRYQSPLPRQTEHPEPDIDALTLVNLMRPK